MPHKKYSPVQFEEKAIELRQRLVPGIADSLFLESHEQPAPIDGLAFFAEGVFKTIREQKELNLPAQRLMVAEHRCHEIS